MTMAAIVLILRLPPGTEVAFLPTDLLKDSIFPVLPWFPEMLKEIGAGR